MKYDLIIIGAGPAGMQASIRAAERGKNVLILEKNDSPGKKLLLCGNRRCNITNAEEDPILFVSNYMQNPKFMLSMLHNYSNKDVIAFYEDRGVQLKIEPEQKIFPRSNKAEDVLKTLLNRMEELKVRVIYEAPADDIITENNEVKAVKTQKGIFYADKVLIATGGKTHQKTGSTGDGYRLAETLGHKIIAPKKSLYPFEIEEKAICRKLSGLTISDAGIVFKNISGVLFRDRGSVLFADFGLTGPLMINASLVVTKAQMSGLTIFISFFPKEDKGSMDKFLLDHFLDNANKTVENSLLGILPESLAPVIVELSKIDKSKKTNQITSEERKTLIDLLLELPFKVIKYVVVNKSVATDGGIDLKEIDNKTLESKKCKGVYFAGELLDVVGKTGGFNLQVAWSTGWTVGNVI